MPPRAAPRGVFDLTPTEDEQMLVDVVTELAAEVLRPAAADADAACAAPDEVLAAATEIGLPLLGVPESLGGISEERAVMAGTLVAEALAQGDLGLAVATLAPGAVATAIATWGTDEQQRPTSRRSPATTSPAAALALTEPRPLFDALEPATTATRTDDGLRPRRREVDGAARRRRRALRRRRPPRRRERALPRRVRRRRPRPSRPTRRWASARPSLTTLTLDGVRVPESAVLGATDGTTYAECVRLSRLAWCALAVGIGQAVLDYVTPYVKEREAFGEPVAHRQSVAFMVADIAIELQAMRLLTWKAASRAAAGKDFAREVALARTLCADKGMQIGLDGVQLLGGHGFVKEHPVERWYRDLRADLGHGRRGARLMINLDDPKKLRQLRDQAHQVAMNMLRPISRKYDRAEHAYPKELDLLAAMIDGLSESGASSGAGASGVKRDEAPRTTKAGVKNGTNLASVMSIAEMCWGDVGLLLSLPRQGLGNSAIASVGDPEQQERFGRLWASMAITEPDTGSDSASIRTTAVLDGDEYVLNGEKIYVTSGERSDAVVVWATLDQSLGRAAIKSFVVPKGTPGMTVERLEHKLGIRASDTAAIRFDDCRVPAANLLGSPDIDTSQGFAGAMATFDNTRPLVAAMAVGCAKAALDLTRDLLEQAGVTVDYDRPALVQCAAAAKLLQMEADWEGARLLMLQAAWMADNRQANAMEASMAKAKAGRVGLRHHPVVRRAVRLGRLQRGRAAREVGARLQDPRHLRGHPADPAADRRASRPRPLQRRAK